MKKILFFLLTLILLNLFSSRAYAQGSHTIRIFSDAVIPTLISGPDYAVADLYVQSPDEEEFTVTGTWGIDFRTGDPAGGGSTTYFVDANPSIFKTVTIKADGTPTYVGTFRSQVINNTGVCLTDINGKAFARARYTPGDDVQLVVKDPVAQQITNIGAMFNLIVTKSDGSDAVGASVTISPADADTKGGNHTVDSQGQVLGIHNYNCNLRHTVTITSGNESKTTTLFSSVDQINPYICNGQSKDFTIQLSPGATPIPPTLPGPTATPIPPTATPVPPRIDSAFLTCSNLSNPPTLDASWIGNSQNSCNVYIRAGATDNQISTSCSNSWSGQSLVNSGTVVPGGTYQLNASDGVNNRQSTVTCPPAPTITPTPTPVPTGSPTPTLTPTPTPSGTNFLP